MDIINVGSLNLDLVYQVPHFVKPGETLASTALHQFVGGKGLNQSIALARAGLRVAHVGAIGVDGDVLVNTLKEDGVNTDFVSKLYGQSGHAVIQISPEGENAIVIFPGTNQQLEINQVENALSTFTNAKALLIQNETNLIPDIMAKAKAAGKTVFYNPAPMLNGVENYPLEQVDVMLLNTIELEHLGGLDVAQQRWPHLLIVLTQGADGVTVIQNGNSTHYPAVPVEKVVDTTAAGDTFIGYFIASYLHTNNIAEAVSRATKAASICITQAGAAATIPKL